MLLWGCQATSKDWSSLPGRWMVTAQRTDTVHYHNKLLYDELIGEPQQQTSEHGGNQSSSDKSFISIRATRYLSLLYPSFFYQGKPLMRSHDGKWYLEKKPSVSHLMSLECVFEVVEKSKPLHIFSIVYPDNRWAQALKPSESAECVI